MNNSRSKNAILNIIFGYIAQVGILFLSFIGRKIFLHYLSIDYLGINGLYSNILTVLSLAELGVDSAVTYSLYKPVAEHNDQLVYSLIRYYKHIYRLLGFSIFAIGIAIIPFLGYIVSSELSYSDIVTYYILFLINTVASYFVAHKAALLSASQQQRVQKLVTLYSTFILQIIHIVVLSICANYYVYITATICTTIISNWLLGVICDKIHPEVKRHIDIIEFDHTPIITRMKSTLLYKLGVVAINNTDNILISTLVSTAAVGLYSNYYALISAVQGFISIITTSMISGIGNLAVGGNRQRQHELFNVMLLFYHVIAAIGGIGFSLLFNKVIIIWLGKQYLLEQDIVYAIAINFYLSNAINPVWMYREANGLFEKVKYLIIIRAFINIVLSIILGIKWGAFGILLATSLSLLISSFWYEPKILFSTIFRLPQSLYWKKQLHYLVLSAVSMLICRTVFTYFNGGIIVLFFQAIIIIAVTVSVFFLCNLYSEEVNEIRRFIRGEKTG